MGSRNDGFENCWRVGWSVIIRATIADFGKQDRYCGGHILSVPPMLPAQCIKLNPGKTLLLGVLPPVQALIIPDLFLAYHPPDDRFTSYRGWYIKMFAKQCREAANTAFRLSAQRIIFGRKTPPVPEAKKYFYLKICFHLS